MRPYCYQLLPVLAFFMGLLSGCEQAKQAPANPGQPPRAAAGVEKAVAKEKFLTSGDSWPSTSHDTLRFQTGAVRFAPVTEAAFRKLPASNLASSSDTLDSPAAQKSFGEVRREGIRLFFMPANGRQVVITHDTTDSETAAYYHYWGTLPAAHQWVVSVVLYEGSAVELIDQRNGRRTTLWGRPIASPDGRYILVHSADLGAAFDENGLQLFKVEPNGPRLLWQRSIDSWEPLEVRWADSKTILVKQGQGPTGDDSKPQTAYVRLDLSEVL